MTVRRANALKRTRRCLKCGKAMYTDRCHRICPKCAHENERLLDGRAATSQELRRFFRQLATGGSLVWQQDSIAILSSAVED